MKLMLANAESNGFSYHTLPALELIPDFIHGFTRRQPWAEDPSSCESRNLQLLNSLGIKSSQVGLLEQVHSADVLVIGSPEQWSPWPPGLGPGDGVVAQLPGFVPVVRTAGCVPVVAVAPEARAVGLFHAGVRDRINPGVCCACEIDAFYSFRKEGTRLRNWTFAGFRSSESSLASEA